MEITKDIVVLYHANCPDGFGAAYAAWKKLGETADYIPVSHGNPPPEGLGGKEIYIVDFSYPKDILLALEKDVQRLTVLDHHIGSQEAVEATQNHTFDIDRSGAGIAWDYFHPDTSLPRLLAHIQDNDLWKHTIAHGKEISAYLGTVPLTFESFDTIATQMEDENSFAELVTKGAAYGEYYDFVCKSIVSGAEEVQFDEFTILAVNSGAGLFKSEVGHRLATKKGPFAIVWHGREGNWHCSLRGDGTVDLSEIAKRYGGGGQYSAASFRISMNKPLPFTFLKK